MPEIKTDLIGKKFGKLVVLNEYKKRNGKTYWLCLCDCGKKVYVYRNHLIKGNTKSCGCAIRKIEGKHTSRLYKIWWCIKERCYNQNHAAYKNYGAKNIKMCDEWYNDFLSFYYWAINNGYDDNLTIDRIDESKNYEPDNCRWITKSENVSRANKKNHRRKTKYLYYGINPNGEYFEFSNANKFAKEHNLKASIIRDMANGRKYKNSLYNGWRFGFTNKLNK